MTSLDHAIQELTSGNETRAEASARSFPVFGEAGLNALGELYSQPEADIRWWAIRAAAVFDPVEYPQLSTLLNSGLDDPDLNVQTCAAVALRERPTPVAIPALIKLVSHSDQLLRRTASDALAALKGQAVEALIGLLEAQPDLSIGKTETVRALALIADPRAVSALLAAWESGSSMVQYWAERGLDEMGIGMAFFNPGE